MEMANTILTEARPVLCLMICLAVFCLLPEGAGAAQVNGKIKMSRNTARLLIDIVAPAPKTIILTLHLPEGTKVRSCKPAFTKADPKNNGINWLLTDVSPGKLKISCKLNRRTKASSLSATARYKNPSNGNMEEVYLEN